MFLDIVLDTGLAAIPVDQVQGMRNNGFFQSVIRFGNQDYNTLHSLEELKNLYANALAGRVIAMTTNFIQTSDRYGSSAP